jgi:long-chain fatty acid transport protein
VKRKDATIMKTRFLLALSLGGLIVAHKEAQAAGTALDVQGSRGTGMASATTAFINDASAIFYNPAGIAQGKGLDAQVGVNLIAPTFKFKTATAETSMPFNIVPPVTAFAAYGITDFLSAGIGVFTPYGLDLAWPDGWEGRSQITKASLRTYYINPTVAAHFGPVRFGAGFQLVRATVQLERDIGFGNNQFGSADLGGSGWGFGGNAGVQVEAIKKYLLAGVAYRSAVRTDFDNGRAHFSNIPSAFQSQFVDQGVTTGVTHPDQVAVALATHPIDDLVIDAEIVWLGWKKFHSIDLNFQQNPALSSSEPKNWGNRVNFHLGGEYTINPHWQVRTGMLYDPSPSPASTLAPDVPDANRLNLAIGGTYKHDSGVFVDVGYQFIKLFAKTGTNPNFPGESSGLVNILGVSVGFTQTRAPGNVAANAAATPAPAEEEPLKEPAPSTPLESPP